MKKRKPNARDMALLWIVILILFLCTGYNEYCARQNRQATAKYDSLFVRADSLQGLYLNQLQLMRAHYDSCGFVARSDVKVKRPYCIGKKLTYK